MRLQNGLDGPNICIIIISDLTKQHVAQVQIITSEVTVTSMGK